MSHTTGTAQEDTNNTQSLSKETPKETFTRIHEPLEGTPFTIAKVQEGWFIALGMHRITEFADTREQAEEKLEKEKWNIFMALALIVQHTERSPEFQEFQKLRK